MKKIIYILTILISAFIPIYFFFLWEPLNSREVMSQSYLEEEVNEVINTASYYNLDNNFFENYENLGEDKKEKIRLLISELSIIDIIKINDYFLDLKNEEKVSKGIQLLKKRMDKEKYEELKSLIGDYITFE